MRLFLLFIFFSQFLLIIGCSNSSDVEKKVDYSTLPQIPIELVMEFGESENYFPARINELFVTPDESIIISDWGSITLEQFSSTGEHQKTIATEGGGPGELSNFFSITDAGNGTLMVEHQGSRRDFFEPIENGLYTYNRTVSADGNGSSSYQILGLRAEGEYFATARNVIRNVNELIQNPVDYRNVSVVLVNEKNETLKDSLHTLQSAFPHLTSMGGGFTINTIPFRYSDRIKVLSDGNYLIARPESSKLKIFDKNHTLQNEIQFSVTSRPITGEDINYVFRDIDRDIQREIEPRLHEEKPPFLDLWPSESHIWLHTDESEKGNEIVMLDWEGNAAGKFLIHEFDEIKRVIDNRLYVIHKNPEMGHSIRIYDVDV